MSEPTVVQLMSILSEMQTNLSGMQTKIHQLEGELAHTRLHNQSSQPASQADKATTRRRLLKKLGAGMLIAGVAAGSSLASQTQSAQAKYIDNPQPTLGMVVSLNSGVITNSSSYPSNRYIGLFAPTETSINLGALPGTTHAAVLGYSNANAHGVAGYSSQVPAVYGFSQFDKGVVGRGQVSGVYGETTASGGSGVQGYSGPGQGVLGKSDNGAGVWGESSFYKGIVGRGEVSGVYGETTASGGVGVHGYSVPGCGVEGESLDGFGVYGKTTNGTGVFGESTASYGVRGKSINSSGVFGVSDKSYGVRGYSNTTAAVYGVGDVMGARGHSANGTGTHGSSEKGNGLVAESVTGAPFKILPTVQPTTGTRQIGEMYVNSQGNLYVYTNTGWIRVQYVMD